MLQISWYFDEALNPVESISTWEFYEHPILNKDNMDSFYKPAPTVLVNNVNFYSFSDPNKRHYFSFHLPVSVKIQF